MTKKITSAKKVFSSLHFLHFLHDKIWLLSHAFNADRFKVFVTLTFQKGTWFLQNKKSEILRENLRKSKVQATVSNQN